MVGIFTGYWISLNVVNKQILGISKALLWFDIRDYPFKTSANFHDFWPLPLELVSKELNHLVAILHVYTGSLIFMK